MFEIPNRDPGRLGLVAGRLGGLTRYETHAHSPHRPADIHLGRNLHTVSEQERRPPSAGMRPNQSHLLPLTVWDSAAPFRREEEPFMLPLSASRWRAKDPSHSTDDTMPDYGACEMTRSRNSTDMSGLSWPRRDFQRHMDEAAVDEIVRALSAEKKSQLMDILSPMRSSSSGVAAPANTPKTAEASKQPSPLLRKISRRSTEITKLLDEHSSESGSMSDDELHHSMSAGKHNDMSKEPGKERTVSDKIVVTRLKRSALPSGKLMATKHGATKRGRSSSESSKRRKLSLSPATNVSRTPNVRRRVSSPDGSGENENQHIADERSPSDGVSVTAEG
jgi:hypothetical protein